MKEETALGITELRNLMTLIYRIKCKYEKMGNLRKNLILEYFREIAVVVGNSKYFIFRMCVCSFIYPACQGHVPCYIAFCVLSVSAISFHFISSTPRLSNKSL